MMKLACWVIVSATGFNNTSNSFSYLFVNQYLNSANSHVERKRTLLFIKRFFQMFTLCLSKFVMHCSTIQIFDQMSVYLNFFRFTIPTVEPILSKQRTTNCRIVLL